jgi:hypothetical protein
MDLSKVTEDQWVELEENTRILRFCNPWMLSMFKELKNLKVLMLYDSDGDTISANYKNPNFCRGSAYFIAEGWRPPIEEPNEKEYEIIECKVDIADNIFNNCYTFCPPDEDAVDLSEAINFVDCLGIMWAKPEEGAVEVQSFTRPTPKLASTLKDPDITDCKIVEARYEPKTVLFKKEKVRD